MNRRFFLYRSALCCAIAIVAGSAFAESGLNLALVAKSSTSYVSGHETITALNDGFDPENSNDKSHGAYGNWPQSGVQWVQYEWSQPVSVNRMEVYWFDDHNGVRLPTSCRLSYWDGAAFKPVGNVSGLGLAENVYNATKFDETTTTKLRLEFDSNGKSSTGLLEWKVYDSGKSPNFAPVVDAGMERVVVLPGSTVLRGVVKDDGKPNKAPAVTWSKESGPGDVRFENAAALATKASFTKAGTYVVRLTADDGELKTTSTVQVMVEAAGPAAYLEPVVTRGYTVNSPFWNNRIKKLIVNWIPHCYNTMSKTNLAEGGIQNFIEAGKKLRGEPHQGHAGPVFANGWVYNTLESMCLALVVDARGDQEILAAQAAIRAKLEEWIPAILSAQEPDGYLHTSYTLNGYPRWSNRADHEGYQAGYFIDAAITHYTISGKKDARLYQAARKLADCWVNNIGPAPKKRWSDGHQALEMSLVRLGRLVDEEEGAGKGCNYVELAKFLLDSRGGGDEYDQTHVPVTQQYEAVGHAVRAVYMYCGMADIAATGDVEYQGAVKSIWNNLINKKYYLTGGVGSGETSEGFGGNYSLPNHAYCESCSGCGELFFQHKLNLASQDSRYVDLYEETLYNAILGDVDLEAQNFTYTNPLDSSEARYKWHGCPCCVGNIPRTLLMLPTWMYARGDKSLSVNLFVGSTVKVPNIAGTDVEVTQKTDYPWNGKVSIGVNPGKSKQFAMRIRIPRHDVSALYTGTPALSGIENLQVNGKRVKFAVDNGYAVIKRTWKSGDTVDFSIPMAVQRVHADSHIAADVGRVALRYGPVVYNIESVDQDVGLALGANSPLTTEWNAGLLDGVMTIKGSFANGAPLLAIPNYARLNRGGRSVVWIKEQK